MAVNRHMYPSVPAKKWRGYRKTKAAERLYRLYPLYLRVHTRMADVVSYISLFLGYRKVQGYNPGNLWACAVPICTHPVLSGYS